MRQAHVIFVGSFAKIKGGVGMACKSVLDNPHLRHVRWIKICSTLREYPPPSAWVRGAHATRRLLIFIAKIAECSPRRILIFSSAGGSFLEKGTMAMLASHMGHSVTFCPRSGYLLDDLHRSRFWRSFARLVFSSVEHIVCQGNQWRKLFRSYAKECQLTVIPNMLECVPHLRLSPSSRTDGPMIFSMFCWMERNKGIYDLLDIVKSQRDLYENCEFHVCGEGKCLADYREQVARQGLDKLIKVRGWLDEGEKLALLGRTHVVLVLSYREGLPNVLLEAMAAGRAIVATNVGAIPDVVVDGETALLCAAGDTAAYHAAMQRLIREPSLAEALGNSARLMFMQNHSLAVAGIRWKKVLEDPGVI